jgi:hypothetical protein
MKLQTPVNSVPDTVAEAGEESSPALRSRLHLRAGGIKPFNSSFFHHVPILLVVVRVALGFAGRGKRTFLQTTYEANANNYFNS